MGNRDDFRGRVLNSRSKAARWAASCVVAICLFGCAEKREVRYADAGEARRESALAEGWIPDLVPDDALDIREIHSVDSNQGWGCFKTKTAGGLQHVRDRLQLLGAKRVALPLTPPGEDPPAWWPGGGHGVSEEVHQVEESHGMFLRVGIAPTREVCFYRGSF